jgi:hypothetical protein
MPSGKPRKSKVEKVFEALASSRGPDECWEWPGHRSVHGNYGRIGDARAHRVVYERYVGPIPGRLQVRHTCDNPPCVNPRHLLLGTVADNMADRSARGRTYRPKLTPEQARAVFVSSSGRRATAVRFGVTETVVKRIWRREYWRDATHGLVRPTKPGV